MAARYDDEEADGFGQYASIIHLGWQLWQTPERSKEEATSAMETFCDDGRSERLPAYEMRSYVTAWRNYIDGYVASRTACRFITNLLAPTAARVVEDPGD